MSRKEKLLILVIAITVFTPIVINEMKLRPKLNLIKDVKEILENIKSYKLLDKDITEEYIINNGYTINNKKYYVNGTGVIFIDDTNSVFLNRNGMCAMKIPSSEDIMIQEVDCPIYRLFNGTQMQVKTSDSGLYQVDDNYVYKGIYYYNYIKYKDILWNIVGFSNGEIKLISTEGFDVQNNDILSIYQELESNYQKLVNDKNVLSKTWNIEEVSKTGNINIESQYESKIGILSLTDYLNSLLDTYSYTNNIINLDSTSYLSREMILSSTNSYLNKNNNIYVNSNKSLMKVYPVIVLSNKTIIISGSGIKDDPYIIKED